MKKIISVLIIIAAISINLNAQVAVIVNKSVSESSIDKSKLRNIFTLTQNKWDDGSKIKVFVKSEGDSQDKFYSFIGKSPVSMRKEWMKKQLTGEAKAPKSLGADSEVIAKVSSTDGAIGYVNSNNITDAVKVLLTIE